MVSTLVTEVVHIVGYLSKGIHRGGLVSLDSVALATTKGAASRSMLGEGLQVRGHGSGKTSSNNTTHGQRRCCRALMVVEQGKSTRAHDDCHDEEQRRAEKQPSGDGAEASMASDPRCRRWPDPGQLGLGRRGSRPVAGPGAGEVEVAGSRGCDAAGLGRCVHGGGGAL